MVTDTTYNKGIQIYKTKNMMYVLQYQMCAPKRVLLRDKQVNMVLNLVVERHASSVSTT